MNVKIAFLYNDIDFDVYLFFFENYNAKNKICKLCKTLYDLKQFFRLWFKIFVKFVITLSYKSINVDKNVFINYDIKIIIAFYVNNILIVDVNKTAISKLKKYFNNKFYIIDINSCQYYLNFKIIWNRVNRIIRLNQHNYIRFMFDRFQISEFKKNNIFINSNLHLETMFENYETFFEIKK